MPYSSTLFTNVLANNFRLFSASSPNSRVPFSSKPPNSCDLQKATLVNGISKVKNRLNTKFHLIICISVSTSSIVHAVPVNKASPLHTVKLKDILAREHRSENTIVTKLMATEKTILEMGCSPSIPLTPLYFRGAHPSPKCARYVTSCYRCCLSLPWT